MTEVLRETGRVPDGLAFEVLSPLQRAIKRALINPFANYAPAGLLRGLLRFGKSELAQANWDDPGGWKSMVISYNGRCRQIADRVLVRGGTMPMALRNRKRLAARLIAGLIEQAPADPVHVLCLGAGAGCVIMEALSQTAADADATLVDLSADAFDFGRRQAAERGLTGRIRYLQADVRDLRQHLNEPCQVVQMFGICEYLDEPHVLMMARAAAAVMRPGTPIVFNSLSAAHGTDRFFRRVFGLHMIHRRPAELAGLMAQAGFGDFVAYPEPLGVYHVIVGRKGRPGGR